MIRFTSTSPDMTMRLGRALGSKIAPPAVIALDGDLGAGKTLFTRGIAEGLGVTSPVSSPTFTIVNEYEGGRFPMYHFDTYRLADSYDFEAAGLDEYFGYDGLCVIVWRNIIDDILPKDTLRIRIEGVSDQRTFEAEGPEDKIALLMEAAVSSGCEIL
ncbi:MAG: tRNA (adenosine(37)-N6)-threonylcarbamoyltransferase complex ATPase subunit type 1 TsaE [Clostridiales bacterium]|nr:tRNA (adenosine(37)-N6)-threonylcarbamoyltransferase complex ATPase subunit type 1 TsaE [Clostridiales bacterium]